MANGSYEIKLEADVVGLDEVKADLARLETLLDEAAEIIELLGESSIKVEVRPSRQ